MPGHRNVQENLFYFAFLDGELGVCEAPFDSERIWAGRGGGRELRGDPALVHMRQVPGKLETEPGRRSARPCL